MNRSFRIQLNQERRIHLMMWPGGPSTNGENCLLRWHHSLASDKNTATPGRQLQVNMTGTCRGRAPASASIPVHICSGRVLTVKPRLSLNFNFEICDSALKLEFIGINLQVNLNLNFRSKPEFKLTLTCFAAWAWGSPIAAAARQPRGGDSDCQYWVVEWRTLTPAAALRPRLRVPNCRCWVAAQLELPAGQVEWSKGHCSDCQYWVVSMARASWVAQPLRCGPDCRCLVAARTACRENWVKTMLTLAFLEQVLEFKGPVLVKANKSPDRILWNLKFIKFLF